MILLCYLVTIGYILCILGLCGILKKKGLLKEEGSRKLVHIFVGFAYVFMYNMV